MHVISRAMIALGFIGATTLGMSSPTQAQGFYADGPGVSAGIGAPWPYDRDYQLYDRAGYYGRSGYHEPYRNYGYRYDRAYRHRHHWDWD